MAQYKFMHRFMEEVTREVTFEAPKGLTHKQVLELYFDTPIENIPDGDKIPADAEVTRLPEETEWNREFMSDIAWLDDDDNIVSCEY